MAMGRDALTGDTSIPPGPSGDVQFKRRKKSYINSIAQGGVAETGTQDVHSGHLGGVPGTNGILQRAENARFRMTTLTGSSLRLAEKTRGLFRRRGIDVEAGAPLEAGD